MLPFVSDPGLSALLLFLVFMGQIVFEKYLVNGIVRNVLAVFMLDYLLKTPCTTILLFVDFQNKESVWVVQIGLWTAKFL